MKLVDFSGCGGARLFWRLECVGPGCKGPPCLCPLQCHVHAALILTRGSNFADGKGEVLIIPLILI